MKTSTRPMLELLTLPTIAEALQDYLAWLRGRKLSPRTVDTYSRDLRRFARLLGDDAQIGDITTRAIEAWQATHAHLSATSMIRHLTVLRSFASWCIKQGWRADDPTRPIDWPRKADPLPRALTADVLARLEAALSRDLPVLDTRARTRIGRDRRAVLIMLYTGARLSEAAGLRWEDIDLTARTLAIHQGKGNKSRMLPLHARLAAELATTPAAERRGAVLTDRRGQPIDAKTLAHSFDARSWLRTEWELPISAHQLRHCFATQLLISGVDLRSIQLLLGHRSLDTTMRYLRVSPEGQRSAIASLPERFAAPTGGPARQVAPEAVICAHCGSRFLRVNPRQIYCSTPCNWRASRARRKGA